ncbi:hypothetical protein HOLleu_42363 [Holothuria leucospilota]|uniref:Uncharacterized protein n=1 Tax=Holothuria leucospilota TaxID=206669 RepID=A0A9Q1BBN0_HOLLE|nr:hypothetical protein HOLleu_42363 [Holothuria leucospilota]
MQAVIEVREWITCLDSTVHTRVHVLQVQNVQEIQADAQEMTVAVNHVLSHVTKELPQVVSYVPPCSPVIPGFDKLNVIVTTTLPIGEVQEGHSFLVSCSVNLLPADVTLSWTGPNVQGKIVSELPEEKKGVRGSNLTLTCEAFGNSMLIVEWLFMNESAADTFTNVGEMTSEDNFAFKTTSNLTFNNLSKNNSGIYTCQVRMDSRETDSADVNLIVVAPSAPRNPTVEDSPEKCVVNWDDSESPNGPGLYYEVTQFIRDSSSGDLDESPGPVKVESVTKYELQKADMMLNSEYAFRICANNSDHEGDCTDASGSCMTSPGAPDSIPMIEKPDQETDVKSSSVILTLPKVDIRNGPISCYEFVVVKRTAGESGSGSPDDVQFEEIKSEPENDSLYRSVVMNQ